MSAWKRCANCPELIPSGTYCDTCSAALDKKRGTSAERGYGTTHRRRFRRGVLARDPICTACHLAASTVADHWPISRRELERRGMNPNDPANGRGLCKPCHDRHTAAEQAAGWNA